MILSVQFAKLPSCVSLHLPRRGSPQTALTPFPKNRKNAGFLLEGTFEEQRATLLFPYIALHTNLEK